VKLKAIDAKNLTKPIKMALRTRDKLSFVPEELHQWLKSLNPGLHTEKWRVLIPMKILLVGDSSLL